MNKGEQLVQRNQFGQKITDFGHNSQKTRLFVDMLVSVVSGKGGVNMSKWIALTLLFLTGCAAHTPENQLQISSEVPQTHQAVMLVSMEDGRIVMQNLAMDAEICWKANDETETNCYKKGEPIVDPDTQQILGYETERTSMHLLAAE